MLWRKRQRTVTLFFLALFAVALYYSYQPSITKAEGAFQTSIYLLLLSVWAYTIRVRVIQVYIQRCLREVCIFLLLWILLRALKYYTVPPGTTIARYLWYLYYIPMLFFPVCALEVTIRIGKPEDYRAPRRTTAHVLVSGCSSCL